jgi:hypothetical protein
VKERNNLEDLVLDRRNVLHLTAGYDGVDWIQLARVRSNDGLFRPQQWLAVRFIKDGKFVSTCHVDDRQLLKMALLHEVT